MLTVIPTKPGYTRGIEVIVKLMEDNPDNLLGVIRITRVLEGVDSFIYIAIFHEKNSLGEFVAFINEFGTSWGRGSGDAGRLGHALIESYIEDNEISLTEIDWNDMDVDIRDQLGYRPAGLSRESDYDRCKVWERFIFNEYISDGDFWDTTSSKLNARWEKKYMNFKPLYGAEGSVS